MKQFKPVPDDPCWNEIAVEAADEVSAWVAPPPLHDYDREVVGAWFARLKLALVHLGINTEEPGR